MTYDPNSFVIRRPRHCATDDAATQIWLEEVNTEDQRSQPVTLCDFSRKGAKVDMAAPMTPAADIELHVQNDDSNLDICLPAKILWQRRIEEGTWALGLSFNQEVAYEVIGELFLSGVLDMESRSR